MDDIRFGGVLDERLNLATALAALAWIDADPRARLIVDQGLAILWANPPASDLLREKQDVEERSGALAAIDVDHHARLLELLSDAGSRLVTYCIPSPGRDGHLLVRASPLDGGERLLWGLILLRSDRDGPGEYRDLDTAFALTPSEHRVLLALLTGKEADRLTHDMGVTIETIRTHIRNIYAKMEVNSRESLFARAQPFRI